MIFMHFSWRTTYIECEKKNWRCRSSGSTGCLRQGASKPGRLAAKEKRMRAKGRNSREYLPSEEREDYIAYARRRGCTLVTLRQKNRYVDEFVRFCFSHSGHSHVKDIDKMDFLNYGKWLESGSGTYATGQAKIGRAIQWFNWLAETGRIKKNPARGLIAGKLIPSPKNVREESATFGYKPGAVRP
jgi:hypothetical protein